MKSFTTQKWFYFGSFIFCLFNGLNAQVTTVRVPQDYPNVRDAMFAIKGQATVLEAIIEVDEGDILTTAGFGNFDRALKLTVQGAGAGKSIIRGFTDEEDMPEPGGGGGRRFLNMNAAANAGAELIFKDLTFRRWGFGDANGGGVVNLVGQNVNLSFVNCNFEDIRAEKGAITQSTNGENTVNLENCFIAGGYSFDRGGINGMIFKKGGTLIITNTTFMSNIRKPATSGAEFDIDRGSKKAGLISLESSAAAALNFVLEGCMFVNNQTAANATDTVQPMISFYPLDGVMEVTLSGNLMIGNLREAKEYDADIYITDMEKITWTNSGNVINKALMRVTDGETENFVPAMIPECDINMEYNYTHQDIGFVMAGDLPKIMVDEFGVKFVGFEDITSAKPFQAEDYKVRVYPNPNNGIFTVLLEDKLVNAKYEVYNALGSLIISGRIYDNATTLSMQEAVKGIYIVRISNNSMEYYRRFIIK